MPDLLCVCGAGTMGSGIAQSAAQHGIRTILYDINPSVLLKAGAQIENELQQLADKNRISLQEKKEIFSRILFTHNLNDCRAGVIIEAVIEIAGVKSALFTALEKINEPVTVFASNSSSLSIQAIAEQTDFPERIAGMHFFNPAPKMKLVEIVRTSLVQESVIQTIRHLALHMGKTPVICGDTAGFIVNRIARPFYLEALRLAEQGVADIATIDRLAEAAGFKMGPFHLMDLIGNDVNFTVSSTLYEALGKPARLKPSPLQQIKVTEGNLGRKVGRGFFEYKIKFENEGI